MLRRMIFPLVWLLVLVAILFAGCGPKQYNANAPSGPSLESVVYKIIVSSKAFIDSERKAHPECFNSQTTTFCSNLTRAVSAQNALVDAAEVYCSGPSFEAGGACQPPQKGTPAFDQAAAKLQAAISAYEQIEKDVKGAVQ